MATTLTHPVGSTVMARDGRIRDGRPSFTMVRALVTGHVTGPGTVPGYRVRFPHGPRAYVTTAEVLPAPLEYPADHHLTGVALRAATRTSRMSPRVGVLLRESLDIAERHKALPYTTVKLDVLLRRSTLGRVAYRVASALEAVQEATGRTDLDEAMEALNRVGVDHRACAWDLQQEAGLLAMHLRDLLDLAQDDRRFAAALDAHLESEQNR